MSPASTFDPGTGHHDRHRPRRRRHRDPASSTSQNNPKVYARNGPAINVFGDNNADINGRINDNPDVQVVTSQVGIGHPRQPQQGRDRQVRDQEQRTVVISGTMPASTCPPSGGPAGSGTDPRRHRHRQQRHDRRHVHLRRLHHRRQQRGGHQRDLRQRREQRDLAGRRSIASFRARVPSAAGYFRMQGFSTDAEATWNANGNTPTSSGGSEVSFGGSGTFGTCTTALPGNPGVTP